jgi:hypothetical protein
MRRLSDVWFALSLAGMIAIAAGARGTTPPAPTIAAAAPNALVVHAAWLAQRESAVGDWDAVRPPLREGDELQLTVRADEDAWVYVVGESDGQRHLLFPGDDESPSLARVRAGWAYAVPARDRTWRLDDARHDRFWLIVARHPLAHVAATLGGALDRAAGGGRTVARPEPDVELPLRDGRPGTAEARSLAADALIVAEFTAR